MTAIPLLTLVIILLCIAIGGESDLFGEHDSFLEDDAPRLSAFDALPHPTWPESNGLSYPKLKKILLETPDADKAREWSKYYTAGPHLCGKNLSQAEWTRDKWAGFGVPQVDIVTYEM